VLGSVLGIGPYGLGQPTGAGAADPEPVYVVRHQNPATFATKFSTDGGATWADATWMTKVIADNNHTAVTAYGMAYYPAADDSIGQIICLDIAARREYELVRLPGGPATSSGLGTHIHALGFVAGKLYTAIDDNGTGAARIARVFKITPQTGEVISQLFAATSTAYPGSNNDFDALKTFSAQYDHINAIAGHSGEIFMTSFFNGTAFTGPGKAQTWFAVNVPIAATTAAAFFQQQFTQDSPVYANGETVTVGGVTYTFKTTLTGAANEVLTYGDAGLLLLVNAINAGSNIGTWYGVGTVANPLVYASGSAVYAKSSGTVGNSIGCSETCANAQWIEASGAVTTTLKGGVNSSIGGFRAEASQATLGGGLYRGHLSVASYGGRVFISSIAPAGHAAIIYRSTTSYPDNMDYTDSLTSTNTTGENFYDSLIVYKGNLYAQFSGTGEVLIKKFDGTSWTTDFDMGANGATTTGYFVVKGDDLFASGTARVFRKRGATWSTVLSDANITHGMLL
jgi:hypothetical protein